MGGKESETADCWHKHLSFEKEEELVWNQELILPVLLMLH